MTFEVGAPAAGEVEAAQVAWRGRPATPLVLCFGGWPGAHTATASLRDAIAAAGMAVATVVFPASVTMPAMNLASDPATRRTVALADARIRARASTIARVIDTIMARPDIAPAGIGVLGYSFGGALAAECGARDPRIVACVNIDGLHFGDAVAAGVRCPYLFISDDSPVPTVDSAAGSLERRLVRSDYESTRANIRAKGDVYVTVLDATHEDLGEPPPGRRSAASEARTRGIAEMLDTMVPAFLAAHLLAGPAFPGGLAAKFPALRIERLGEG